MAICPFATWQPVVSHDGLRPGHYGFVHHVEAAYGNCYGFFSNPTNEASSHFWISQSGALSQYVDTQFIAWAEMAGNGYYISCEFEGEPGSALTAPQLATGGRLIAWCADIDGFPLVTCDHGGQGVTTHAHYPSGVPDPSWGGHPCPGPIRSPQTAELVLAARPSSPPAPPAPPANLEGLLMSGSMQGPFLMSLGPGITQYNWFGINATNGALLQVFYINAGPSAGWSGVGEITTQLDQTAGLAISQNEPNAFDIMGFSSANPLQFVHLYYTGLEWLQDIHTKVAPPA